MGTRKLRTKKGATNISATEVVAGDNTIIAALERVLETSHDSELNEETLAPAQEAFTLLKERLQFTPLQSMVIAMLIDNDGPLNTKSMAHYLSIRNMQFITHMPEIADLIQRRIVRKTRDACDNLVYLIVPAAARAYMRNEVYVAPSDEHLTLANFFARTDDCFTQCNDKLLDTEELQNELSNLVEKNKTLLPCKHIISHTSENLVLFLLCCREYINDGDTEITPFQYQDFIDRQSWHFMRSSISSGSNPLFRDKLIEYHGSEGLAGNSHSITIAEELRKELAAELGLPWENAGSQEHSAGLLRHTDIAPKQLYYNATEQSSIAKLSELLQPESFTAIQERLAQSGMRKGFACLFFGTPGTGKTETALQLAKSTGRDIMQVNITDIKSKWVGESEQNIKNIFERYRRLCQKCAVQPILLFNEADAVIGARMENTTRSVDKMENALQNIILEEMEKLEGILIATTNLTNNMDKAFERRFLYKVEFTRPTLEARRGIWQTMIPTLSTDEASCLAAEYDLSGGQIENIARKRMVDYILYDSTDTLDTLRTYCDSESLVHIQAKRSIVGFR